MMYDALKRAGHTVLVQPAPTPPESPPQPGGPSAFAAPQRTTPKRRQPWPEIVGLYYNIDALRSSDGPVVLQFVASRPGEGTSAVAREFAAFAAGEQSTAVLLVDCDHRGGAARSALPAIGRTRPPTLADVAAAGGDIEGAIELSATLPHVHEARLSNQANSLLHVNGPAWSGLLDQARQRYRFTVLDSPAVTMHPDSVVLARACDGVVVVVEAETTRGPVVQATIDTVERFGGKVLGLVFNKRRFYIPRWVYRRL